MRRWSWMRTRMGRPQVNHSNPERTAGDPEGRAETRQLLADRLLLADCFLVSLELPGPPSWVGFLNHSAKSHLQTCPFVMKKLPISPPPPS